MYTNISSVARCKSTLIQNITKKNDWKCIFFCRVRWFHVVGLLLTSFLLCKKDEMKLQNGIKSMHVIVPFSCKNIHRDQRREKEEEKKKNREQSTNDGNTIFHWFCADFCRVSDRKLGDLCDSKKWFKNFFPLIKSDDLYWWNWRCDRNKMLKCKHFSM